ncbi:DNA glycosylase AlkZ-like family protein [Piscinibacter sakaiensis]|uniref:DNA glycosylase AlkZ-like family protein n=1 Tax=Piscinibacter sakaiensis TaxID=1547922 RepID=UPI003AADE2EA
MPSSRTPTLDDLRRHAVARSLFRPTTLPQAVRRLGFVQADPIRAPARAQDLILRHRVADYQAGELERRYPRLDVEEDFFINYGFLPRRIVDLMHPRTPPQPWSTQRSAQAAAVLEFVRERGVVHPREVDQHFAHGKTRNWFGGTSNASTELLDAMHYLGLLRVARRDGGTRVFAVRAIDDAAEPVDAATSLDALVDVIVDLYAPLPARSLSEVVSRLRAGTPQWAGEVRPALQRALQRLPSARVNGIDWFWPAGEDPASRRHQADDAVRLLAPFDPIVWDRRRFELLWGWAYRFEAYTPPARRQRGYYALPMLWGEQVIGWTNLAARGTTLDVASGFVAGSAPPSREFATAFDEEIERLRQFLMLQATIG